MDKYRVKKTGNINYGQCTIRMILDQPWESDGKPRNNAIRAKRANFVIDFTVSDFLEYFKKLGGEE